MNDFAQVLEWLQEMERNHEDLKAKIENMFRVGPVSDRDKDKGVRLKTDADQDGGDEAHKSDWGRPAEWSGFQSRIPRKGEQCLFIAAFGDQAQGIVIPLTHNDDHPNPASDVDEIVIFNHGKIKKWINKEGTAIYTKNDKSLTVQEGDKITHTIEKDGKKTTTVIEAGKISHNVEDHTTTFEKDKIHFPDETGRVEHGGRNIGKDHKHTGVMPGMGDTGDPDA